MKSCVNKQKSDMQNFYNDNDAAKESRTMPIISVEITNEGRLQKAFSLLKNFILKAGGSFRDYILKTKERFAGINAFNTSEDCVVSYIKEHISDTPAFCRTKAFCEDACELILRIVKFLLQKKVRVKFAASSATLLLASAICITANAAGYKLGYEVSINGEPVGMVVNQDEAIAAVDSAKEAISQYVGEEYDAEPVFSRAIVAPNTETSAEEIENTILSSVEGMIECAAIFVDGEPLINLSTIEDAESMLQKYKEQYFPENITDDMIVEFCENVEVKTSFISADKILSTERAFEMMTAYETQSEYVVSSATDTLWNIAKKNDMTLSELKELNKGLSNTIHIGDVIKVKEVAPLLSVRVIEMLEYDETVPFETEIIYSDDLYIGDSEITTEGGEGWAVTVAKIVSVNGVEESREIVEQIVTVEPIDRIKTVGTKPLPQAATGKFGKPTTTGSLSSNYGSRWGRNHNGIDISLPCNNAVYAADGGVVTYSSWMSGYGNYIIIDHQNGYQTAYGHNNQNLVSVGQRVAKGEKIALSGNTGNSTGPHLHFEVKKNGVFQNPLGYVKY